MKPLHCSIIVTNWNGKELLRECLPTVISAVEADQENYYEIIVVDDCSTDDSVKYLKETFPEVKVVVPLKNLGFQEANNFGVKEAQYPIVMIVNNDIKMDETSLAPLIRHFKAKKDLFGVSGKVYGWDKKTFMYGNRGGYFKYGHFSLYEKKENDKTQSLFVCGGAGMFDKEKYLKLGGFDNLYHPLYYEEIDVSYRALKKGWKVIYEPESKVYHRIQQTITKQHKKDRIGHISGRNNYLFVLKNITSIRMLISAFFFIPLFLLRDILRGKTRFWVAFAMVIPRIPQLIKSRIFDLKVKNMFTDEEVLELVNVGRDRL